MNTKTSLALILSIIIFTSCKNDDDTVPMNKSTMEKIVGHWNGLKTFSEYYYEGDIIDSLTRTNDISYVGIEFTDSNVVHLDSLGVYSNALPWSLIDDNTVTLNLEEWKIRTLNSNRFVVYSQILNFITVGDTVLPVIIEDRMIFVR